MEGTIESRSGELLSVPLSRLVASAHNVRKTGGTSVEDLKALRKLRERRRGGG